MDSESYCNTRPSDVDIDSNISEKSTTYSLDSKEESKDHRSAYERDRDKILYSREFRRLKNVTQVARAGEMYLHHDRLTHSTKVAQVGQRLSQLFIEAYKESGYNLSPHLPDIVESACLAHDLGHPPFGHISEEVIDTLVRRVSSEVANPFDDWESKPEQSEENMKIGFEGNAQSFRVITRLASRSKKYDGMDLTRATLNAVQKYPWARGADEDTPVDTDNKWGYYPSDDQFFKFARHGVPDGRQKTIEAEIMDYADDVTYAVHDVDDFYRDGLIPLGKLLRDTESLLQGRETSVEDCDISRCVHKAKDTELGDFAAYVGSSSEIDETREDVIEFFLRLVTNIVGGTDQLYSPYRGTAEERNALNKLVSRLIGRYLESSITDPSDRETVVISEHETGGYTLDKNSRIGSEIEILKNLTVYYVISDPTLAAQQRGQRRVIAELFEALYKEANPDQADTCALPRWFRPQLRRIDSGNSKQRARLVADIISSLTEQQAVTLHSRLTGDTPGSLQEDVVR